MKFSFAFFVIFGLLSNYSFAKNNSDSVTYHGHLPVSLSFLGTGTNMWVAIATIPTMFGPFIACPDDSSSCSAHVEKTKSLNPGAKLVVNTWGEGRIVVFLVADPTKGCAGIQGSFVGYETASKTYDLYVRNGDELPVPNSAKASASLIIGGKEAFLQLRSDFQAKTNGKAGHPCTWDISKDSALNFKN